MSAIRSAARIAAGALVALWLAAPLARSEAVGDAAPAETATEAQEDTLVAALSEAWVGDLDGIIERGLSARRRSLRPVPVPYDGPTSRACPSISPPSSRNTCARPSGGRRAPYRRPGAPAARVMFDALIVGRVDLLTANLTVTEARAERVDFADPILTGVSEIVVTGPAAPPSASLDDLAGLAGPRPPVEQLLRASGRPQRRAHGRRRHTPSPSSKPTRTSRTSTSSSWSMSASSRPSWSTATRPTLYEQVFEHLTLRPGPRRQRGRRDRLGDAQGLAPADGRRSTASWTVAHKGTELGNILFKRWLRRRRPPAQRHGPRRGRALRRDDRVHPATMPPATASTRSSSRRRATRNRGSTSRSAAPPGPSGSCRSCRRRRATPTSPSPTSTSPSATSRRGSSICASCATAISAIRD